MEKVIEEIEHLAPTTSENIDFKSWPLDLLVDYILKIHHRNIRTQGPEIEELLDKICRVHGEKHPSLYNVQALFHDSLSDLNAHLDKEELVLFPYIYEMVKAKLENTPLPEFHCGSIEAPISVMMAEHDIEGERYRHIEPATVTASYSNSLKHLKRPCTSTSIWKIISFSHAPSKWKQN